MGDCRLLLTEHDEAVDDAAQDGHLRRPDNEGHREHEALLFGAITAAVLVRALHLVESLDVSFTAAAEVHIAIFTSAALPLRVSPPGVPPFLTAARHYEGAGRRVALTMDGVDDGMTLGRVDSCWRALATFGIHLLEPVELAARGRVPALRLSLRAARGLAESRGLSRRRTLRQSEDLV